MKSIAIMSFLLTTIFATAAGEGLIGHWRFDPALTTRVMDAGDNGLHASARGIMPLPDEPGLGAMLHNASIRIDNDPLLMPTYTVSVMAWIRMDDPGEGFQSIYRKEDGEGRLLLMLKDRGEQLTFGVGTSDFEANPPNYHEINAPVAPGRIADGRWHLIAGVYDGLRLSVYLDGKRLQTRVVTGFMSNEGRSPAFIGSTRGKTEFFNGAIREVRLYGTALSAREIANVYNAGIDQDRRDAEREQWAAYWQELEAELKRQEKEKEYQPLREAAIATYHEALKKRFMDPLNVEAMALHSMAHHMSLVAEPLEADPSLIPVHFYYQSLPDQVGPKPFGGIDFGDATARAVINWPSLREMTGDSQVGLAQEEGARRVILALLHPKTGLAMQMRRNEPHAETTQYCYMWDQSRVLRALVRWYATGSSEDRDMLRPRIDLYLRSLASIADVRGTDEKWGGYLGFSNDNFNPDGSFSTNPRRQWIQMRSGLMLEPVVDYFVETGDPFALTLAKQLAACVAGGHESGLAADGNEAWDPRRLPYTFGPDGEYTGHVHTRTSTLLGMAKLAKSLYLQGDKDLGLAYLDIVEKAWDWSFSSGAASRTGWWVEFIGRQTSEIDQCADAIELAAVLASLSELSDPRFERYSKYYDFAESFLVNYITRSHIEFTPEYVEVLKTHWVDDIESKMQRAKATDGAFSGMGSVGDLTRFHGGGRQMVHGACCTMSGMRGLHAGWRAAMEMRDGKLQVNYFINRTSPFAEMVTEQPRADRSFVRLKQDAKNVFIRIPGWADPKQMRLSFSGRDIRASDVISRPGYAELGPVASGESIEIRFDDYGDRELVEKIAGGTYAFTWRGNYVVEKRGVTPPYLWMWPWAPAAVNLEERKPE